MKGSIATRDGCTSEAVEGMWGFERKKYQGKVDEGPCDVQHGENDEKSKMGRDQRRRRQLVWVSTGGDRR